ncbi:hypothetical protein C8Q79DRAFT_450147 [Trametes meyenii]|nr:hypothetical protein C8Q79DRAFT_450147 [Trametes meyenii]
MRPRLLSLPLPPSLPPPHQPPRCRPRPFLRSRPRASSPARPPFTPPTTQHAAHHTPLLPHLHAFPGRSRPSRLMPPYVTCAHPAASPPPHRASRRWSPRKSGFPTLSLSSALFSPGLPLTVSLSRMPLCLCALRRLSSACRLPSVLRRAPACLSLPTCLPQPSLPLSRARCSLLRPASCPARPVLLVSPAAACTLYGRTRRVSRPPSARLSVCQQQQSIPAQALSPCTPRPRPSPRRRPSSP